MFLVAVALLLGAPSAAWALGPRYASPTGTSAQDCASLATACDIQTAINGSGGNQPQDDQEVIVEPGSYTLTATLSPTVDLNVHGVVGMPRPVISASGFPVLYPNAPMGETFSYLEFDTTDEGGNDAINTYGATLDQLVIKGDSGGNMCQCYDGTLRNSLIIDSATGGSSAWGINSNGGTGTEILRNDTFVATTASASAMWVLQDQPSPGGALAIDAKNVIAINTAGGHDVNAEGAQVIITMSHSDYSSPTATSGGVITDAGGNLSAAPAFVDAAQDDFHELASSPTIDAGTDDTVNDGTVDLDGNPRLSGAHTDMGAYEFQSPAAISATAGTSQSAVVATAFGQAFEAKVTDAQGNPVSNVTVTFNAPQSEPTATFPGNASTVQATTAANGVASAPALTAGHRSGTYTVTASVGGVAQPALFSLHNTAGPPAAFTLTPQTATVNAGEHETYSAEASDIYGNDVGPVLAPMLTLSPDGSCSLLACTALFPGMHTVTAVSGQIRATATVDVVAVPPRLRLISASFSLNPKSPHTVAAICTAPGAEVCTVSGTLTTKVAKRTVRLGTVSGKLRSPTRGTLKMTLTRQGRAIKQHRKLSGTLHLTLRTASGNATVTRTIRLNS
jgi:hypothetical protein